MAAISHLVGAARRVISGLRKEMGEFGKRLGNFFFILIFKFLNFTFVQQTDKDFVGTILRHLS